MWGEGIFHQIFGKGGPAHDEKMEPTGSKVLKKKIRCQKHLRAIKKKGKSRKINDTKCLKMTDLAEIVNQL